jgi:opacity protein-like surface antigen
MKLMRFLAVAAVIGSSCAQASDAHGLYGELNGARVEGRWGGEIGAGYALSFGGFRLSAGGGAFVYRSDNDRYYEDANGGNERCRDSQTGRYAKVSECNNVGVKGYGRVEGSFHIPAFATVGAGARIGSEVRPYGTISLPLGPVVSAKANGGPHYAALGIMAGF